MQIVEFNEKLLPSLTRLINEQIARVPPGFQLNEGQIADTIARGGSLWDIHFPSERELYAPEVLCVLERREVVAAAQWFFLVKKGTVSIQWLVAQPGRHVSVRTLLHLIDKWGEMRGAGGITFARFAFGVGWFGLPATWTHLIDPMLDSGYRQTEKWVLMHGDTGVFGNAAPPSIDSLNFYWNMNKPALEWELSAYRGERLVGEAQVWGIPPHLEDSPPADEWATVELVEVEKAYRRHGVGKWLLAEQMRFHSRRGVQHLIAWTRDGNRAGRKLHRSMGFEYGPKLAVLEKP